MVLDGTMNKFKWSSGMHEAIDIPVTKTDIALNSITLPSAPNWFSDVTILFARLKLIAGAYHSDNSLTYGNQYIQIRKEGQTSYTNAIFVPQNIFGDGATSNTILLGEYDISSVVDEFGKTYELRWKDAQAYPNSIWLEHVYLELEIWFSFDSGLEEKINSIIEHVSLDGEGTAFHVVGDPGNSTTSFKTDLLPLNPGALVNGSILFLGGNNARFIRRIVGYNGATGFISIDAKTPLYSVPQDGDRFVLIPYITYTDTYEEVSSIKTSVEDICGNTCGCYLEVVDDPNNTATSFRLNLDEEDYPDDFFNDSLILANGTRSSNRNWPLTRRVVGYDSSTQFITVNKPFPYVPIEGETYVILPKHFTDVLTSETLNSILEQLGEINSGVETISSDVDTIDGKVDTIDGKIDTVSGQISEIQNNVFFSTTVLQNYQRPESGSKVIKIKAQIFDGSGNPEDPDDEEIYISLIGSISGVLVNEELMTKLSVGLYEYVYEIESTDNLEDWEFKFSYTENSVPKSHFRHSQLSEFASDLNDIQAKVTSVYDKLPTNYIMGSGVKDDKDSEIDAIKERTDRLPDSPADEVTSQSILSDTSRLFDTALGALFQNSFADLIMNKNSDQTFDRTTDSLEAIRDNMFGGNVESIADAVWDEIISGHLTLGSAGAFLNDIEVLINSINGRIPSSLVSGLMNSYVSSKASGLGLTNQEKTDVRSEVDNALVAYDGATQSDLDALESNLEDKLSTIQIDLTTLLNRIGVPSSTIYQAILDTIDEINENEALIITLTGNLEEHDTNIRNLIGTPVSSLITDMNSRFDIVDSGIEQNYNAILQIQNNTTVVLIVPCKMVRPDSDTKPYVMYVLNRNLDGAMEDFIEPPTIRGDYASGVSLFGPTAMLRTGLGEYLFSFSLSSTAALGAVTIKVTAETQAHDTISIIRVSEITDYDDELAEIKADTEKIIYKIEADTPDPTIPEQISEVKTQIISELRTEINENQDLLEVLRDTPFLKLIAPSVVIMNNGFSKISNNGNALHIGSMNVPLLEGTLEYFQESGFIYIDDGPNAEKLEYVGKTPTSLILKNPTTKEHDDGAPVYSVVSFEIRLFIEAQDKMVYHEQESAPTLVILDEFGTEISSVMDWDSDSRSYIFTHEYIATKSVPGRRNVIVSTFGGEGGIPAKQTFATFEVLDRPASQESIDFAISGGIAPNTYIFDHDGWKDESNIMHEWEDEMAGPLLDDTGKPATGIIVRAFLKGDDERYLLVKNPPYQGYSNIFGHYRGSLEAGTYLFTFYKDGFKWKEVERKIG